jgi:hypothetical protein
MGIRSHKNFVCLCGRQVRQELLHATPSAPVSSSHSQVAIDKARSLSLDQLGTPPSPATESAGQLWCDVRSPIDTARAFMILVHIPLQPIERDGRLGRQLANDTQPAVRRGKEDIGVQYVWSR